MGDVMIALLAASMALAAGPTLNREGANTTLALHAELGFLGVLSHSIQFGKDGTELDYVADGGQDVLFPFARLQADVGLGPRHQVVLLYQPLDLRSQVALPDPLTVDDVTFDADTPLDLRYGFSFWRASWLYDLRPSPDQELAFGLSLQIRNANIVFTDTAGTQRRAYRNIGPVPILKFRGRHTLPSGPFVGAEVDGFWAPIRYLNGGSSDVEGAIVDASVRGGVPLSGGAEAYLNLRWIGGGAVGTSDNPTVGDGYTRNWLHFVTLSAGFTLR